MQTKRARFALLAASFTETQSFERDQLFELLDDLSERIKLIEDWLEQSAAGDGRVELLLLSHKGIGLRTVERFGRCPYFRRRVAISVEQGSGRLYGTRSFGEIERRKEPLRLDQ